MKFLPLVLIATIVVMFLTPTFPLSAQEPCTCTQDSALKTLNICIDNVTYSVTVYGCSEVRNADPLLAATCTPGYEQNQYTKIRRVCFNGARPVPIDAVKTFSAILCTMKPVVGDSSWNYGIIPAYVPAVWCWTIFTPKCATVDQATGCILACGTLCCRFEMRWVQTANGHPTTDPIAGGWERSCPDAGVDCGPDPCALIGCPNRDNCCIRN